MSRRIIAIVLTIIGALALASCSFADAEKDAMDQTAVATTIEQTGGVVSAEVGEFSAGTPNSYGARVQITVDRAGLDDLGGVLVDAARAVAADPGRASFFDFEVTAPDEAEPDELVVLTLSRYRDRIPFAEGSYVGSTLTLTADELAQVAAG